MSLRPINISVINTISDKKNPNIDIYNKKPDAQDQTEDNRSIKFYNSRRFTLKNLKTNLSQFGHAFIKRQTPSESQVEVFQSCIKYCIACGQFLGLFPIMNVKDLLIIRCKIFSWRFLISLNVVLGLIIASGLTFYRLTNITVNITSIAYFSFYGSNCITVILFVQLARKWNYLIKVITTSDLNEYVDQYVKYKCNIAVIIILSFAFTEHVLSRLSKFAEAQDCNSVAENAYEKFIKKSYPWIFELNFPYTLAIGIYLPILNFVATMIWSFSHLFIICVSFYLTSILEQLNTKILSHQGQARSNTYFIFNHTISWSKRRYKVDLHLSDNQYLTVSYWRSLREDYNRATRLVRSFDDVINPIVFASFASNLFFVCLQLYYVVGKGLRVTQANPGVMCSIYSSSFLNGYIHVAYFTFSVMFVLLRSLAVSLIAAKVHSASLEAAPALYSVPSPSYCTEVQRFIEQIHGDTVALTGLNFFYVTKELVLSVVGTIVTYELVLLQFNGEDAEK